MVEKVPIRPGNKNSSKPHLDPEKPTFCKGLYEDIMIRNPEKVGYLGLRQALNSEYPE